MPPWVVHGVSHGLHADHEKETLIARTMLQSGKHLFQHQYGDYSHYTSRAKEPLRITIYKFELRFLAGRKCMGFL